MRLLVPASLLIALVVSACGRAPMADPAADRAAVHALVIDEMAKYRIPSLTLKRADFFVAPAAGASGAS